MLLCTCPFLFFLQTAYIRRPCLKVGQVPCAKSFGGAPQISSWLRSMLGIPAAIGNFRPVSVHTRLPATTSTSKRA